jgi:multicomponent K+:H+ antiporter subunit F
MSGTYTAWALQFAIATFSVSLAMCAWRLFKGPSAPDRILALDTMYVNALALIILLGIHFDTQAYFEAALLVAMLGFVGTVTLAKYLLRGDVVK